MLTKLRASHFKLVLRIVCFDCCFAVWMMSELNVNDNNASAVLHPDIEHDRKFQQNLSLDSPNTSWSLEGKDDFDYSDLNTGALRPHNADVSPMLTDLYQITMCYAYWRTGRHEEQSVFDLFFRKHPFQGEFTIFCGLEEVLRFISSFKFAPNDIAELKRRFPDWQVEFWDYLGSLNASKLKIFAIEEGSIVIPRIPLIRVEGPLAVANLLETTILVLVNYSSLVATNAARHRLAVGPSKTLLEFGLRRAQGPDGGISASRYSYCGGFDGTSNVKAAQLFGIPVQGTHAHSFVTSFMGVNDLKDKSIIDSAGKCRENFVDLVLHYRGKLNKYSTNGGELAAFIAYAQAYPKSFLALIDTYETLESGLWNFIVVALALNDCGYPARGIRLDSGDLAYLSRECRKTFRQISLQYSLPHFEKFTIVASNDLSEQVLWSLKEQGHEIDSFAVGTHLVTCKTQPALGCVYKLVEVNQQPRIKISQDSSKVTIPGRKEAYRLFNAAGEPVLDLLIATGTTPPVPHKRILCRHPFDANKRVYVTPSKVEALHALVWDGRLLESLPSLREIRNKVSEQLQSFREDHLRRLNPTPYKLSVTSDLYTFMHDLWLTETPIAEIK
jgi:nicotinate phosphoribosyltransferase